MPERAGQSARAVAVLVSLAHRDIARGALRSAGQRVDHATTLAGDAPDLLIDASACSPSPAGPPTRSSSAATPSIACTPMEQEYLAKSANPDKLQDLLDKLGRTGAGAPRVRDDDQDSRSTLVPFATTVAVEMTSPAARSCMRNRIRR